MAHARVQDHDPEVDGVSEGEPEVAPESMAACLVVRSQVSYLCLRSCRGCRL